MSDSRSTSDAAAHATTSSTSFYELLSLPPEYHPTQETPIPLPIPPALLRKTYRKTSLLYHPDKNPSPDAAAHFHTLTTAYDVLSDAATKQAYDQALVARLVRKRKSEFMGSERRRLKEELEARERAAMMNGGGVGGWKKQKMAAEGNEEEEFERQLSRLKEEGARLRLKREEALRKAEMEAMEEEGKMENDTEVFESVMTESMFTELDRTIFIKLRTDPITPITESMLTIHLTKFGEISSCLVREPPPPEVDKVKKKKKKKKEAITTVVLVFKSILAAYDVVHASRNGPPKEDTKLWERVREVKFAGGKEPDVSGLLLRRGVEASAAPTPQSSEPPIRNTVLIGDAPTQKTAAGGPPKFSFHPTSSRQTGTSKAGVGLSSADYESVTLLRMREMERKTLEAEIRAKEAKEANEAEEQVVVQEEIGDQHV